MNVKVITRHAPSNYGSLLQCVATQKVIESLGHQCEIIDYIRKDERGVKAITTALSNKKGWNDKWFKKLLYVALRYPEEKLAEIYFGKMREKHLCLSNRCYTYEELQKIEADVFMTGSDQVWGNVINGKFDEAYFLTFAPNNVRKVAYAASFGRTDFTKETLSVYKEMLKGYAGIAVREDNAVELLNDLQISNLGQVLDPTLLLDEKEWNHYVSPPPYNEKYILVYEIHNNPKLDEYAKKLAQHTKIPLIRISASLHQINRGGKLVWLPCLEEFLSLVKNCTCLVTDSFHGTAFALIFNRQIVEVMPNNSTSSRNHSILKLTGLTDRVLSDTDDFSFIERRIDYERVNLILKREKAKSMNVLERLLLSNPKC